MKVNGRQHRDEPKLGRWWLLGAALIVGYASTAYLAINYVLPTRLSGATFLYIAQPVIWGLLAALSLALLLRTRERPGFTQPLIVLASLGAALQVVSLLAAGGALAFARSAHSHEVGPMAQNALYAGTLLLGVELSRAYLMAVFGRSSPFLALCCVSLGCALLLIPVATYDMFSSPRGGFEAFGRIFLPGIAESLAASYFVSRGGPLPAIIYRGGIEAFRWFSPIVPDIEWNVAAFAGTMAPAIVLLAVRGSQSDEEPPRMIPLQAGVSPGWVLASAAVVALLWFSTGMLGVQPAVVSGASMEPTMHSGDLVLTRPEDTADLKVGDIVRYDKDGAQVVHRILEIADTAQGRVFVTKGDNNETPDEPIVAPQVVGKVVLTVPKVGWAPIAANKLLTEALAASP